MAPRGSSNGFHPQPQSSFEEVRLDDARLETLLDDREAANTARKPYQRKYTALHKQAKQLIEQKELTDGDYRIGQHIVSIKPMEDREVSFELHDKRRVSFKLAAAKK